MDRKEVERQAVAIRLTALDGNKGRGGSGAGRPASLTQAQDAGTLNDLENGVPSCSLAPLFAILPPSCSLERESASLFQALGAGTLRDLENGLPSGPFYFEY